MFKKKKKEKGSKSKNTLLYSFIPLVLAFVIFFGLVSYKKVSLRGFDSIQVVVATVDVPKKTVITEDNVNSYFKMEDIQRERDIEGTLSSLSDLYDKTVTENLFANSILSDRQLGDNDSYESKLEEPTRVSFSVTASPQAVGGTLRPGDYIDVISVVNGDTEYIAKNIKIAKVFDASGISLNRDDKGSATTFIVILDKKNVLKFQKDLSSGNVNVVLPE